MSHHHLHKRAHPSSDDDSVFVKTLGAGREVGRSCIIIKFKGRTIMLDCGIHPGRDGEDSLPFFSMGPEPSEVDLILISHFHLDHAASLPYFTEKTYDANNKQFSGKIFATHPTKAIMRLMLVNHIRTDSVRQLEEEQEPLYTEEEMQRCLDKIEVIDYHQVMEYRGIRFWCYNAGHVLGAAMFMIEIGGVHILYTGDYSREDDRHLMAAQVPDQYSPDILIVESTYGSQNHPPKEERERRFTEEVARVVRRGGRCLLPVFALGRAQELMLILDEYWHAHRDLQHVPIYYASKTSDKAHRVYETYVNMMNEHVRQQMDVANPFRFAYIRNLKSVEEVDDMAGCVVMASPGFMSSGPSRRLFDRWCSNADNGVIITGYTQEGTLAKELLSQPDTVKDLQGNYQPLRCSLEYISFSAHVDYGQNESFIREVNPSFIILVHGEEHQMNELRKALERSFSTSKGALASIKIQTPEPRNDLFLEIPNKRKTARTIGKLAESTYQAGDKASAIYVRKNFMARLLDPQDLSTYTQLRLGTISQKVHFGFHQSWETLRSFLDEVFDAIEDLDQGEDQGKEGETQEEGGKKDQVSCLVDKVVKVTLDTGLKRPTVTLEWSASPVSDMVADAIMALAMEAQSSPVTLKMTSTPCCAHRRTKMIVAEAKAELDEQLAFQELEQEQALEAAAAEEVAEAPTIGEEGEAAVEGLECTSSPPVKEETTAGEKDAVAGEAPVAMDVEGGEGETVKEEKGEKKEGEGEGEGVEGEGEGEEEGPVLTPEEEMRSVQLSRLLHNVLSAIYGGGNVELKAEECMLTVTMGQSVVEVSYASVPEGPRLHVESEDHLLRDQVAQVTSRVLRALGDHE